MFGIVPAIAMTTAACLFSTFTLDEGAHDKVRAAIVKGEATAGLQAKASVLAEAPSAAEAASLTRGRRKSQSQQQQATGEPSLL